MVTTWLDRALLIMRFRVLLAFAILTEFRVHRARELTENLWAVLQAKIRIINLISYFASKTQCIEIGARLLVCDVILLVVLFAKLPLNHVRLRNLAHMRHNSRHMTVDARVEFDQFLRPLFQFLRVNDFIISLIYVSICPNLELLFHFLYSIITFQMY